MPSLARMVPAGAHSLDEINEAVKIDATSALPQTDGINCWERIRSLLNVSNPRRSTKLSNFVPTSCKLRYAAKIPKFNFQCLHYELPCSILLVV